MILTRMWGYNPFFIPYQKTKYELKKIHFFDNTGIRLTVPRGWFGNHNNEFEVLEFNTTCQRKLKPNFDLSHAFFIPVKANYYEKGKYADLYFPWNLFEWEIITDARFYDSLDKRHFYDRYINKTIPFEQDIHTRTETIPEVTEFLEKIKPLAQLMNWEINEHRLGDKRKEILEELRRLRNVLS